MTDNFRKTLLYADAAFLILIGGIQVVLELVGYFQGAGPLGDAFHESPYAIGFVEAHGLALMMGVLLAVAARPPTRSGNVLGLAVHFLLGGANLLFWSRFAHFGLVPMGVAATVAHFAFVLLHALCLTRTPAHQVHERV